MVRLTVAPDHPMFPWVLATMAASRLAEKGDRFGHELMDLIIVVSVDPEGDAKTKRRKRREAGS